MIDQIISDLGGLSKAARALGITRQRLWNWRSRGVPAEEVIRLAEATGWTTTPHQIAPEIYPHEQDGLPSRAD